MKADADDLAVDTDPFAYFNYQYVLYGMQFDADLVTGRQAFPLAGQADPQFDRVRTLARRVAGELPGHRALLEILTSSVSR